MVVSHDIWFLKQVIRGWSSRDDNGGGSVDDVLDGEPEEYTVTQKGELKRWEKGLDAYVDKVQRLSMSRGLKSGAVK